MTSQEIEILIAKHFGWRTHLIVTNVSWGWGLDHEADMIVVTKSNYAWEIEIKVSAGDLRREKLKSGHHSPKIARLYFAIPEKLAHLIDEIEPRAGVFVVGKKVKLVRAPRQIQGARKLQPEEVEKLKDLSSMRVWNLKVKLINTRKLSRANYAQQEESKCN